MSFDRGFIKWQPFNSVVPSSMLINNKASKKKPILFEEEMEKISDQIKEAYYAHDLIKITFYEAGQIKLIETYIQKINPSLKTLILSNYKTIYFNQIIKIN